MRGTAALALALALVGCADWGLLRGQADAGGPQAMRSQREAQMNRQWQDRPLSELMQTLGRPQLIMHIPGGGMPPSFAVVYGVDPGSGCIDAFAVSSTTQPPLVRVYHCR